VTGARLHLIRPFGFEISDKHLKRAGLDYWDKLDITYYDNLEDFFNKNKGGNFFYFTTKGKYVHSEAEYPDNCYLVFGKETAGLNEELLKANKERCLRLPMLEKIRSLNLSNSVAIAVYEVLRQWSFDGFTVSGIFPE
jgi:tRNA (cytidine/uridine-2'-O-)-methyltransferase